MNFGRLPAEIRWFPFRAGMALSHRCRREGKFFYLYASGSLRIAGATIMMKFKPCSLIGAQYLRLVVLFISGGA